jgi:hypothetical protein
MSHPEAETELRPPPGRSSLARVLAWGCLAGLLLAVGGEAVRVLLGGNLHVVVPGRIYRCAQPKPAALADLVRRHGIRTVVNLRGCCAPYDWYMEEARAIHELDLCQEDICLSAYRLPSSSEMRRLVEVLDRTEFPIVLHCRRGADRTGLVAAVCQLLFTHADLGQARKHMGPRFGHVAVGQTANLDRFLDQYEEWLQQTGQDHRPAVFRHWLGTEYCGSPWSCRIEPLQVPEQVPLDQPWTVRVRFHNTSGQAWRLSAANTAGVHAAYLLTDAKGNCLAMGRAALFDGAILADQSLDVTLDLPAVGQPGPWFLTVDLHTDRHGWFYQFGSEPLHMRISTQ